MQEATQILGLDPAHHQQAVNRFFAYFGLERRRPEFSFLVQILAHFAKMPYENISKILKFQENYFAPYRIRMPEEVMADYEEHHLGGTCFSLTFFLQAILVDCGYLCYPVIADMPRMKNSHCCLVVVMNGNKHLVDPGYLLNKPFRLDKDTARYYRTEHTGVELNFDQGKELYSLSTFQQNNVKLRYRFRDTPISMERFLQHWLDSFYWPGMKGICLTKVTEQGMIYVHNDYVQIQNEAGRRKGVVENMPLLVNQNFSIDPEWIERARAAIPEIITRGQQLGFYRKRDDEES